MLHGFVFNCQKFVSMHYLHSYTCCTVSYSTVNNSCPYTISTLTHAGRSRIQLSFIRVHTLSPLLHMQHCLVFNSQYFVSMHYLHSYTCCTVSYSTVNNSCPCTISTLTHAARSRIQLSIIHVHALSPLLHMLPGLVFNCQ